MHANASQRAPECAPGSALRAEPVDICWNENMPVFAKEEFLRAVGSDYGWIGGIDGTGELRCVLPYTVERRGGLRLVRFRMEPTPTTDAVLTVDEEKTFLNGVVRHFRTNGADVIVPATNNAIFRTYPDGADAAPYGSYVIDLEPSEDVLWKNIGKITRQNIGTARADGVVIREGLEFLDAAHELVRETYSRSKMAFMSRDEFQRYAEALGTHGKLLVAEHQGTVHSCTIFAFSAPCAYAVYGGNVPQQHQGSMKLLQWEAIRRCRELGVRRFDFFGARVNPAKGSKQEAINQMKKRFGATLVEGYMWKYTLRPWRARVYSVGVRLLRGGDIVDQERHKLPDYRPNVRY